MFRKLIAEKVTTFEFALFNVPDWPQHLNHHFGPVMPDERSPNDPAMFHTINSIPELGDFISANRAVIVYFSHEHCNVCTVLKPKLDEALSKAYPDIKNVYIDIKLHPQFAAEYQVNTVPVVLLYLEGREFIRKTRTFSVKEVIDQIERPYRLMIE